MTRARRGVRGYAPPSTRTVMAAPSWGLAAARAGVRPWRLRLPAARRCSGAPPAGPPDAGTLPQQTEERLGAGTAAAGPRQVRAWRGGRAGTVPGGGSGLAAPAGPSAGPLPPSSASGPEQAACFSTAFPSCRADSMHSPPVCLPGCSGAFLSLLTASPCLVQILQKWGQFLRFLFNILLQKSNIETIRVALGV